MAVQLPEHAQLRAISAHYNDHTLPRELLARHVLLPQQWARVVVEEGELAVKIGTDTQMAAPERPVVIPPDTMHAMECTKRPLRFYLEFYHPHPVDSVEQLLILGHRGSQPRI